MGGRAIRRSGGFTMAELMVALAVAAILATCALLTYSSAVRKAKRAEGRAALLISMQQQEDYYSRNNTYVVFSAATPSGFKWHSGSSPGDSAYELSAQACADATLQECILLLAMPGTAKVNRGYSDEECGVLSLDSSGVQGAASSASICW